MICLIKNIIFISLAQIQVNLAVPTLMLIYSLLRFLTGTFCIMKSHFFHLGLILLCNPVQGSLIPSSILPLCWSTLLQYPVIRDQPLLSSSAEPVSRNPLLALPHSSPFSSYWVTFHLDSPFHQVKMQEIVLDLLAHLHTSGKINTSHFGLNRLISYFHIIIATGFM